MNPFILIPWQNDFIHALAQFLYEQNDFSKKIILFPHNRPRRYLKAILSSSKELPKPSFLPRILSLSEFTLELNRNLAKKPMLHVNQLDLVELLRVIVNSSRIKEKGLLARLPELDREHFLPWGMRLASLMDDLYRQNIEPTDLNYMEGEVSTYASALLEQLSTIHQEYTKQLKERNWTTPGMDWQFITEHREDIDQLFSHEQIIAAGFYALSGAEDTLFRHLWEKDILIPVIHSDQTISRHQSPHWAASEHFSWLKRWGAHADIPLWIEPQSTSPSIRFCEGFDRHSQLAALTTHLNEVDSIENSAIVLPDEGALLPVLHHLPDTELNISMGYPLERTSLARLIECILTLQENRLDDGRYVWRDVINLIRHPYLRLLGDETKPLRKVFQIWEAEIRTGERFIQPHLWMPPYGAAGLQDINEKAAEAIRHDVLHYCIQNFEAIDSLDSLGDALHSLAAFLHEQGSHLWHTYLIDAECLFRVTTSVIPQIKSVQTSSSGLSLSTLFTLLRNIIAQERVSFEAEPLAGLQVIGVLETRLLHFKRVYILDAIEDLLPGTNPYDPLLPDALRKLVGLPDTRERDNVAGYNFYRLIMGADDVMIYYQNGIQPGLLDSKSVRSRFVEQLLWIQEQEKKKVILAGDAEIQTVTFPTGSLRQEVPAIPVTSKTHGFLLDKLQRQGVSPSRLDQYMHCPKQFFYTYLSGVRPLDSLDKNDDKSVFGTLIHQVLREYLTPYIGIKTNLAALAPLPLLTLFERLFKESEIYTQLTYDKRLALSQTARHHLTSFLASQETATLLSLEQQLNVTMDFEKQRIPLTGQLDRVEHRENGIYIFDYKTGNGVLPRKSVWDNMELWDRIHTYTQDSSDTSLLTDLSRSIQSVQLPVYMYLFSLTERITPYDAGLIKLGNSGKVEYAFGEKWTSQERSDVITSMTPTLIQTLIRHMTTTTHFSAQPSHRCQWCDFKLACGAE